MVVKVTFAGGDAGLSEKVLTVVFTVDPRSDLQNGVMLKT